MPNSIPQETIIERRARDIMRMELLDDPDLSFTELAERTAIEMGHDEWLDDETNWIWELALKEGDQDTYYDH